MNIKELPFEHVTVKALDIFNGYEISFVIENQTFHFLIGKSEELLPLNIKHYFKNQEHCNICQKMIFPTPFGQQPCLPLQKDMKDLLSHLRKTYVVLT
ncbi:hypothetical protein ACFYKX_07185 [Cytobacillus sp. FJAT-54145]|uniref:Uncharacterized protein n=1 Tax=Cytobacillus spartinae TaxID=3299023 RepID=A0ABW6K854_9BACI